MDFDIGSISSSIDSFFEPKTEIKPRIASSGKIRVASARDLAGFTRVSSDTLVHVSQKDFWKIGKDDEGHFIERLVDDGTGPIVEEI